MLESSLCAVNPWAFPLDGWRHCNDFICPQGGCSENYSLDAQKDCDYKLLLKERIVTCKKKANVLVLWCAGAATPHPGIRNRWPPLLFLWGFTRSLLAEAPCEPQRVLLVWYWDKPGLKLLVQCFSKCFCCWSPGAQHLTWPTGTAGTPRWTLPGPSLPCQMQRLPRGG